MEAQTSIEPKRLTLGLECNHPGVVGTYPIVVDAHPEDMKAHYGVAEIHLKIIHKMIILVSWGFSGDAGFFLESVNRLSSVTE